VASNQRVGSSNLSGPLSFLPRSMSFERFNSFRIFNFFNFDILDCQHISWFVH
jgi:hypothetical protein